jgi:hypothetical protein
VIDVFYKIKALHKLGVEITLHCFQYGREKSSELEKICKKVYYYPRISGFLSNLSFQPYIIKTRRSSELLNNLLKDESPILFEGLHATYYIKHKELRSRIKIVRTHNIEHKYYYKLFKAEKKPFQKVFYLVESFKLFFAQKRLKYADGVAAISRTELKYFIDKFTNSYLINPFHSNENIDIKPGRGDYILYHGNLSVAENVKAVKFLVEKVFMNIDFAFIIAGKRPSRELARKISAYQNVKLVSSPGPEEMRELIQNAHANILVSFQDTGIKLKLIESLFLGRHCVANKTIIGNSGLDDLCEIGNSPAELSIQIKKILDTDFNDNHIEIRKRILENFRNEQNAGLLISMIVELQKTG